MACFLALSLSLSFFLSFFLFLHSGIFVHFYHMHGLTSLRRFSVALSRSRFPIDLCWARALSTTTPPHHQQKRPLPAGPSLADFLAQGMLMRKMGRYMAGAIDSRERRVESSAYIYLYIIAPTLVTPTINLNSARSDKPIFRRRGGSSPYAYPLHCCRFSPRGTAQSFLRDLWLSGKREYINMYVCVYMCVCVCMYACVCVYVCMYAYIYIYICYLCLYMYMLGKDVSVGKFDVFLKILL